MRGRRTVIPTILGVTLRTAGTSLHVTGRTVAAITLHALLAGQHNGAIQHTLHLLILRSVAIHADPTLIRVQALVAVLDRAHPHTDQFPCVIFGVVAVGVVTVVCAVVAV